MPDDLRSIAFPALNEAQMAEVARCPTVAVRMCRDGETIFAAGDRDFRFFIIKSGEVEIYAPSEDNHKTVVVLGERQFTGEISHLTGAPAVVSAVARGDCELYDISLESLQRMLSQHPPLGDLILQAFIARRQLLRESPEFSGLRVIGSRYSPDTLRIRNFLAKNRILFTWLDLESDPQVNRLLERFGLTQADTPVVASGDRLFLRNPSNRELAEALGIRQPLEHALYDLVIVGSGPAGMAAAVYGASEGLRTLVLERFAPGGQAGSSTRIENYLGFPTGLTGSDLSERAILQIVKFGGKLSVPAQVTGLRFEKGYPVILLDGEETVTTKCLLIATGADYRRMEVEGCERFEGSGVYYAATFTEAQMCRGSQVVVVGGGNSAGQGTVFLAEQARKVILAVRGESLYDNMSAYLAQRIEDTPNIEVQLNTTVRRILGDKNHLTHIEMVNNKTGEVRTVETQALFSFIGVAPRTDWLPPEIERESKGFIRTGKDLEHSEHWTHRRQPYLLETSHPGVFAAGDVRYGSIKRIASAVGEGAMAVQFVHEYLKEM